MAIVTANNLGGRVSRQLLPVAILVPIALEWLRLMGQRIGLYNAEFGLSLGVSATTLVLSVVIWNVARTILAPRPGTHRRRGRTATDPRGRTTDPQVSRIPGRTGRSAPAGCRGRSPPSIRWRAWSRRSPGAR